MSYGIYLFLQKYKDLQRKKREKSWKKGSKPIPSAKSRCQSFFKDSKKEIYLSSIWFDLSLIKNQSKN